MVAFLTWTRAAAAPARAWRQIISWGDVPRFWAISALVTLTVGVAFHLWGIERYFLTDAKEDLQFIGGASVTAVAFMALNICYTIRFSKRYNT